MENVSETNDRLVKIEALGLQDQEVEIIKKLLSEIFTDQRIEEFYFLQIHRGLSDAKKIAVKPHNLYPLLIKISTASEILKEYEGYKTLKFRINTSNLLQCEGYSQDKDKGAIAYHYVTKGRVRDTYDRLDTMPENGDPKDVERVVGVVNLVFEYALKKSHFGHGLPKDIRPINLNTESNSVFTDCFFNHSEICEVINTYNSIINCSSGILAPFGTVHGDLHPKNILVGMNDIPILIDYSYVTKGECIFLDYSKLEVYSITMFPAKVTNSFFERKLFERQYSTDPLILPRSSKDFLSSVIFEIRKNLWKNCMSNNIGMNYIDIDKAYRAYLSFHFLKVAKNVGVSDSARLIAYKAIMYLGGASANEIL